MRMPRRPLLLATLAAAALAAGALVAVVIISSDGDAGPETLIDGARFPTAMVALSNGGLLYGERGGPIRSVSPDGDLRAGPVATVDTAPGTDDQRGLLGLVRDDEGRLFAAWTRADDARLVVGQVDPGPQRLVWEGPPSADMANGGHLILDDDGRIVIGVGDLTEPERVDEPDAPHGKLLALDPDGEPAQRPVVLSTGWNNPFSFTFTGDGALWVADNAPPSRAERLARADLDARPTSVTELEENTAPSGVASLGGDRLAVCGFVSRDVRVYDIAARPAVEDEEARLDGCRLGVVAMADGRLALADEDRITVVPAPEP